MTTAAGPTQQVVVRVTSPFPTSAWPRVWHWIQPFAARVTDDFCPRTITDFVSRQMELAENAETWGVWRDREDEGEELGGMVWVDRASAHLAVVHLLFKKDFWGRATTEPALREVFDRTFRSGIGKICSNVFADNHQLRGLVRTLGAQEEGKLREHTLRFGGKPADMIAIGLLKRDFYANTTDRRGDHGRGEPDRGIAREEEADRHINPYLHGRADGAAEPARGHAEGSPGESDEPRPSADGCGVGRKPAV